MENDSQDIDIAKITQILKLRKKMYRPTALVLGARAGGLFYSQILYDTLSAVASRPSTMPDSIEKFQYCVRVLEQDLFNERDTHSILLKSLQDTFDQERDRYIATLAKRNFFQLVITTNIDVGLENALLQLGLRMRNDFTVLIPGHSKTAIASLRNTSTLLYLMKVYGDLALGQYDLKQRSRLLEGDPYFLQQLQDAKHWNMLIVGFDPLWDEALVPFLFPCLGTVWYVNEEKLSRSSLLFEHLQHQNTQYLFGPEGASEHFFSALYRHIVGSIPLRLPEVEIPVVTPPFITKQATRLDRYPSPSSSLLKLRAIPSVDVLLCTTTDAELKTVLHQRKDEVQPFLIENKLFYDLGMVGDARVFLMHATFYPDDLEKSRATFREWLLILSPANVIMVGTAQGFKYKRQQIGDLLISEQILMYETLRDVDKGSQEKEVYLYIHKYRLIVSPRLLSFFKNASIPLVRKTKKQPTANFGLIFSSNEPMDQQTTFHYLNKFAPDAIGIEIAAGAVLFSVAQRHHLDCIMVKGISCYTDEAIDQDSMMPEIACTNAARFTLQVIELGGFHASIPHPEEE